MQEVPARGYIQEEASLHVEENPSHPWDPHLPPDLRWHCGDITEASDNDITLWGPHTNMTSHSWGLPTNMTSHAWGLHRNMTSHSWGLHRNMTSHSGATDTNMTDDITKKDTNTGEVGAAGGGAGEEETRGRK